MPEPLEPDEPRTAYDVLASLLDLCSLADRQRPAYRAIPTEQIRDAITCGLNDAGGAA